MTDIASLGIRVDTTGVKQSAAELKHLAREAAAAERAADSMGKKIGKVASGLLGAYGLGRVVGEIIRATVESERVQGQLEARVKSLGANSAASVAQINKLATSLQNLSTFDDEKIKSAATSLLAFTNIKPGNFDRALKDIGDLATATGDDLVAAAEKVGKALNNPLTASRSLRDVGIELTKSQKDLIKSFLASGDAASAQKIVLDELEKRYAGAAEAARNTLGGALKGLKNDFDNLLEGDGKGIRGSTDAINDLAATMRSDGVRSGFQVVVNGLFSVTAATVKMISGLGNAASAVSEFFAENDKKGINSLRNKREDLEGDLFARQRAQKRSWLGPTMAENAPEIKAMKSEIAEIDRLITLRGKEQRQAAAIDANAKANANAKVTVLKRGKGIFANVTGTGEDARLPPGESQDDKPKRIRTGGGGGGGGVSSALSDARAALETQNALAASQDGYHQHLLDMQADIAGPLAKTNRDYEKQISELNIAFAKGEVTLADYVNTQAVLAKQRDKETDAIKAQLTPFQELLAEKERDLQLMGLQGVARDLEIDRQRLGRDLTIEETVALRDKNKALEDGARSADFQRAAQDSLSSSIYDFVTGAKSAKDAAKGFFDSIAQYILKMAADNWAKKIGGLFSGGSANGGSGGGTNWFSAIAGLFGGGKASGGPVSGGKFYEVGEGNHPELLQVHGKQFLIPGNNGNVTPMQGGGRNVVTNTTFLVEGRMSRETQSQVAQRTASVAQRASARNR